MAIIFGLIAGILWIVYSTLSLVFYMVGIMCVVIPVLIGLMVGSWTTPVVGLLTGVGFAIYFFRKMFK